MTQPTLYQLIYVSAAKTRMTDQELEELLRAARRNNAAAGITGLLLYERGSFLQLLEGPKESVEAVFAKIGKDPRHHRVVRVHGDFVEQRAFGDWSMGFHRERKFESSKPPGFSDFFEGFQSGQSVPSASVASQMLNAFRSGSLHVYVES